MKNIYIYTQQKIWRGAEIELNEFTVCTGYCRGGGELQESKRSPGSGGASVGSEVVLGKLLHVGHIYRQLPAESGRDGMRVWEER